MMVDSESTILLVEDDDDVREVAGSMLESAGYRILEATNADAAFRLLRDRPDLRVDLLVTDIVMPGRLDGVSLAEAASALRPELKILYTTGYADLVRSHRGVKLLGPLLHKPFRARDLCRMVEAALGGDRVRRG